MKKWPRLRSTRTQIMPAGGSGNAPAARAASCGSLDGSRNRNAGRWRFRSRENVLKEIPLTRGYVALVDDEDYERVSALKWYAVTPKGKVYAQRRSGGATIFMHDFLMGSKGIDHADGNGINNQRPPVVRSTSEPQSQVPHSQRQ